MLPPAEDLEGKSLDGGWVVDQKVAPRPTATGGCFSTGYLVSHPDGRKGFLKAMDFSTAFHSAHFVDVMNALTEAYIFEREICLQCQAARVTRVVHAIDHGHTGAGPLARVEYLIFERADGDIRAILDQQKTFDLAFALRTLHGTAAALQQMHNAEMAHQDLKPSNVLVFTAEGTSKLGDLGRAWARCLPAPHDGYRFAGDPGYAPPELRYGVALDEDAKRYGYDAYLLGSLVVFLFTRVHINGLVAKNLDPSFGAKSPLTYAEALPYLQNAFAEALREFGSAVPEPIRAKLTKVVAELCEPDHSKRGDPSASSRRRFSLERYISTFDLLACRAEYDLRLGK